MPLFITQGRFTTDALKGMMAKPENREEALQKLAAAAGGKLHAYYMTFGEHDFLTIIEGPIEGMATALATVGASGATTDMKTSLALTASEMRAVFGKAGELAGHYSSPSGRPEGSAR